MMDLGKALAAAIAAPQEKLFELLRGINAEQCRTNELLDEMVRLQRASDPRAAALVAFEQKERIR